MTGRIACTALPQDCLQPPILSFYLTAAVTDFTEMVSPLAVPVTFACSQASLWSSSRVALSDVFGSEQRQPRTMFPIAHTGKWSLLTILSIGIPRNVSAHNRQVASSIRFSRKGKWKNGYSTVNVRATHLQLTHGFTWRGRRIFCRRDVPSEVEFIAACKVRTGNESPTEPRAACSLRSIALAGRSLRRPVPTLEMRNLQYSSH